MFKQSLNNFNKVRVSFLKNHNYLKEGIAKSGSIEWFRFKNKIGKSYLYVNEINTELSLDYNVTTNLLQTKCNYGGVRYWIECPHCKRRCGVLYKVRSDYFACLKCLDLPYASQNQSGIYRKIGSFMGLPKLFELEKHILSRNRYKGKYTKKYKLYLKHRDKLYLFIKSHAAESKKILERLGKQPT